MTESETRIVVVYVGAAQGIHLPYLMKMFPFVEFHLYDPRPFCKKVIDMANDEKNHRVNTYTQFFTEETARQWNSAKHPGKHIIFISDLRTADHTKMSRAENEAAIVRDNDLQKVCYLAMKPFLSMLKFRLPWDNKVTLYMKGEIRLQAYAPPTSTETRLVIIGGNQLPDFPYCNRTYEEQMYHVNRKVRLAETYGVFSFEEALAREIIREYLELPGISKKWSIDMIFSEAQRCCGTRKRNPFVHNKK